MYGPSGAGSGTPWGPRGPQMEVFWPPGGSGVYSTYSTYCPYCPYCPHTTYCPPARSAGMNDCVSRVCVIMGWEWDGIGIGMAIPGGAACVAGIGDPNPKT